MDLFAKKIYETTLTHEKYEELFESDDPQDKELIKKIEIDRAGKFEEIIGYNDLVPVEFLEEGWKAQQAVCFVDVHPKFGSGFLIAPNLVMTNNHIIPNKERAHFARFEFGYLNTHDRSKTRCFDTERNLFFTDKDLDFTILAVKNTEKFGFLKPVLALSEKERINIIQHPNKERKQIAIRSNVITKIYDTKFRYTTDTKNGSSGSPCLNDKWEVIGLHRRAGTSLKNLWIDNEGVLMLSILNFLKTYAKKDLAGKPSDEVKKIVNAKEIACVLYLTVGLPQFSKDELDFIKTVMGNAVHALTTKSYIPVYLEDY